MSAKYWVQEYVGRTGVRRWLVKDPDGKVVDATQTSSKAKCEDYAAALNAALDAGRASHARLVAAARTAYADIEILEGKLRDLGSGPANTRSIVRELEEIKSDLHTALAEVEGA